MNIKTILVLALTTVTLVAENSLQEGIDLLTAGQYAPAVKFFAQPAFERDWRATYYHVLAQREHQVADGVVFDNLAAQKRLNEAKKACDDQRWVVMITELSDDLAREASADRAFVTPEAEISCSWCRGLVRAKEKRPTSFEQTEIWLPWCAHARSMRCPDAMIFLIDYLLSQGNVMGWLMSNEYEHPDFCTGSYDDELGEAGILASRLLSMYGEPYGATIMGVSEYALLRKDYPLEADSRWLKPAGYQQAHDWFIHAQDLCRQYGKLEQYATLWLQKLRYEYGGKVGFDKGAVASLAAQGVVEAKVFLAQVESDHTIEVKQSRPWWQRILPRWLT